MAKQESGFKVIIVLVLIAFLSAVLLAYVNKVTREPIEENKKAETKKAIGIVLRGLTGYQYPEIPQEMEVDSSPVKYFMAVDSNKNILGCAVIVKAPNGFTNDFDMMVGVDSSGSVIDTYVLDHKETPGLGDGMSKEPFKKQFRGKNINNTKWLVKKDKGDIDAMTAATITSRAFTAGVKRALMTYNRLREDGK
jgi:electron transport complex protein RnfG